MIKAIIIDDEQHCIDLLHRMLTEYFPDTIQLLHACHTVEEGIAAIRKSAPSLVFLDVQLQDKTAFDLLQQIGNMDFEVIFTTAYDQYAVQAFKFSALDYLLKPVDADDLKQAVARLVNRHEKNTRLDSLLHNLKNINIETRRICVPVMSGMVFIQIGDIVHCQSEINYTHIFMKDKQKLLVAKTLKDFEEMLGEYNFFRVHNSHLVNLRHIKNYNKGKGGYITMSDGSTIEVSTRRKEDFLKRVSGV